MLLGQVLGSVNGKVQSTFQGIVCHLGLGRFPGPLLCLWKATGEWHFRCGRIRPRRNVRKLYFLFGLLNIPPANIGCCMRPKCRSRCLVRRGNVCPNDLLRF